jgi:hypothetical protein
MAVLLVVAMGGVVAQAGPAPDYSTGARASIYAFRLQGTAKVQILDRLCRRPRDRHRCHQMPDQLQVALEDAIDRPIEWVRRPVVGLGNFWILSSIRFRAERAVFDYSWREPGDRSCYEEGFLWFRWTSGNWEHTRGTGAGACA